MSITSPNNKDILPPMIATFLVKIIFQINQKPQNRTLVLAEKKEALPPLKNKPIDPKS